MPPPGVCQLQPDPRGRIRKWPELPVRLQFHNNACAGEKRKKTPGKKQQQATILIPCRRDKGFSRFSYKNNSGDPEPESWTSSTMGPEIIRVWGVDVL
jgi:hypothetical protein